MCWRGASWRTLRLSLNGLGLLVVCQTRQNVTLPTWILKADLMQGFDLAWRDAIRLQLHRAGVTGRAWLVVDSSFDNDRVRGFEQKIQPMRGAELGN